MNTRALVVGLLGVVIWFGSSRCRAEYTELPTSKRLSTATLIGLGVPALVLDGFSISYATRGPREGSGRRVVFTLQLVEAAALPLAGLCWYYFAGTGRSPRDAHITMLTAGHFVLGLASLGLAIATLPAQPSGDSAHVIPRRGPMISWLIAPMVIAAEDQQGAGLAFAGLY